jgi:hypothetical protein
VLELLQQTEHGKVKISKKKFFEGIRMGWICIKYKNRDEKLFSLGRILRNVKFLGSLVFFNSGGFAHLNFAHRGG